MASCSADHAARDRDREIREALFPEDLAQPSGCSIKGKYAVRARVTGNVGIYHLQTCRSYPGTDQTGSLVLFRRRRTGRRVPQSLQLPVPHQEQMSKEQMKLAKATGSCVTVPAEVAGAYDPFRYFEHPARS